MSEFYHKKDYGEYFHQVEQKLSGNSKEKSSVATPERVRRLSNKQKAKLIRAGFLLGCLVIAAGIIIGLIALGKALFPTKKATPKAAPKAETVAAVRNVAPEIPPRAFRTDQTVDFAANANLKNGIVIDLTTHKIVAARNENERVSPASTTKVMTALVATDLITNYNDRFIMTQKIADDTFLAKATNAGFAVGEPITMTDLLYGCLLPSGADATIGLTEALCGSEAAFVEKMNEKAAQLGLTDTHFTNATGLYDPDHYSSVADMAIITEEALKVPLLKKMMSTVDYTTAATAQHPQGIKLTGTLFSYMYGNEPESATILAGKTGFVNESGYCFTTYGETDGKKPYIVVMFGGRGQWPSVFGLINLYSYYVND